MEATLHATPDNPVPDRARADFFTATDGRRLRYALFECAGRMARGTVVLLHGRNETIEKYYETVGDLTAMGFWVATFDWRGQGGSERLLENRMSGHVRRFIDYERDLERFLEHVVLPDTRLPFFILAHSTGGLVALSAAPRLANRIERMVLIAPFVALGGQSLGESAVAMLTRAACLVGLGNIAIGPHSSETPFEGNRQTSDRIRFERNNAIVETVPELALGRPTARWLSECLRAAARVTKQDFLGTIRIPTLVIAPTRDPIVPLAALEELDRRFRAGHLAAIDGARHEPLQERDIYRAQALAAIEAFIPGSGSEPEPDAQEAIVTDPGTAGAHP